MHGLHIPVNVRQFDAHKRTRLTPAARVTRSRRRAVLGALLTGL
jgi:hypothetical protein